MKRYYKVALTLMVAMLSIMSCSPDSADLPPTPLDKMGHVRVLAANPDHQTTDVSVNGSLIHPNVNYSELSAYELQEPITLYYQFVDPATNYAYAQANFNLQEPANYTCVTYKLFEAENDSVLNTNILLLKDIENTAPNKADIRFLNLFYGSSLLDFRLGSTSGEILLDSVPYANYIDSAYRANYITEVPEININRYVSYPLDEGNYDFVVTKTEDGSLVSEYETIFLKGGNTYYLTLFGDIFSSEDIVHAKAFVSNGLPGEYIEMKQPLPKLLFVNLLSDNDGIDVYVNGTKGASLGYTDNSDYIVANKNSNSVSVKEINTLTTLFDFQVDLGDKQKKTVIAYESGTGITHAEFEDNTDAPQQGNSKIRLINMTDISNVDLFDSETALIEQINMTQSSEFLEIEAKNYKFELYNSSGDAISAVREIELPANRIITFIAYKLTKANGGFEYALKRIDY